MVALSIPLWLVAPVLVRQVSELGAVQVWVTTAVVPVSSPLCGRMQAL